MITHHNMAEGKFEFLLQGHVSGSVVDEFISELFSVRKVAKEILIYINADDGDLISSFAIYDALEIMNCSVVCIGMGVVKTSVLPIFLAGSKRIMTPNSMIDIEPLNEKEVDQFRDTADKLTKSFMRLLHKKVKDEAIVGKITGRRWAIDQENAKEFGLSTQ